MTQNRRYINSINLNAETDFPFLILNAEKEIQTPMNPGFHVMHWHEDLQFLLCFQGDVTVRTLHDDLTIGKNAGVFINKNTIHYVEGTNSSSYSSILFPEYFVSFYPGGPAGRLTQKITANNALPLVHLRPDCTWQKEILDKVNDLLLLDPEETDSREHYCYQVLNKLSSLWLVLLQHLTPSKQPPETPRDLRIRTFLQYIETHYGEDIDLQSLSESAGVSPSETLRCFKSALGISPYKYLMDYRLTKALELLQKTNLPIGSVASMTGFHQQSYFGKCFRERMNCSPSEYRKQQIK